MEPKLFATVFVTVFLAEMGDKTQIATVLYASENPGGKWTVFLAAASALCAVTAIGVLAGDVVTRAIPVRVLRWAVGLGFLALGAWTLWRA
jgi:putative Ca2+/H+ antiporter (TMEM165/GDT1 family)